LIAFVADAASVWNSVWSVSSGRSWSKKSAASPFGGGGPRHPFDIEMAESLEALRDQQHVAVAVFVVVGELDHGTRQEWTEHLIIRHRLAAARGAECEKACVGKRTARGFALDENDWLIGMIDPVLIAE